MIALNARKKLPCVWLRQKGRLEKSTACPLPIEASTTRGRPARLSAPASSPESSRSFGSVGQDSSTRGSPVDAAPRLPSVVLPRPAPPPRPPRPPPAPKPPARPPAPAAAAAVTGAGGPSSVVRREAVAIG